MPELPEVHTTAKMLNELLPGLKISQVWTSYGGIIHEGKNHIKNKKYFSGFQKKVIGQKILGTERRGKNVLIKLSNEKIILVHMKMTGHLLYGQYVRRENLRFQISDFRFEIQDEWKEEKWLPAEDSKSPLWDPFNRFIRLVFSLSNGKHLVLSDVRKFAKVHLIEKGEKTDIDKLGPEPLEESFKFQIFKSRILKRPNGKIKTVLMDQEIIAGIGNIYSDEILWLAGVHPESPVRKIPEKELKKIYQALKMILKKGIEFRGDSTSDYRRPDGERGSFQYHHKAYRQTGKKCTKKGCNGTIERIKIGGRSGHFCPKHQKLYK